MNWRNKLFYLLYCLIVIFITIALLLRGLIFAVDHILFTLTLLISIKTVIFLKQNFRKSIIRNWKTYLIIISSYLYLSFILGTSISLEGISGMTYPLEVIYDQESKSNTPVAQSYRYPLWKTFIIRLWYDLPLRKQMFVGIHYFARSNFYYFPKDQKDRVHCSKDVVCIVKNLGEQSLLMRKITKINIIRDKTMIPDRDFGQIEIKEEGKQQKKIEGLINILNYMIENQPIIIYPSEEITLFKISPACTNEKMSIELEIEYIRYPNSNDTPNIYSQKDVLCFSENSPRILSAKTVIQK